MLEFISRPWPWYVAGPIIGLMVPALLYTAGKPLGVSSALRHACAAVLPGKAEYFKYDWKKQGGWNLIFVFGIFVGGAIASLVLHGGEAISISAATWSDLSALGMTDFSGFMPSQLLSWSALGTLPGFICIVLGGFLVGFGARYAGGCTSGHAISGLANLQLPSLIAVIGFFVGGMLITYFVLPYLI